MKFYSFRVWQATLLVVLNVQKTNSTKKIYFLLSAVLLKRNSIQNGKEHLKIYLNLCEIIQWKVKEIGGTKMRFPFFFFRNGRSRSLFHCFWKLFRIKLANISLQSLFYHEITQNQCEKMILVEKRNGKIIFFHATPAVSVF